jgi:hypothetical protein
VLWTFLYTVAPLTNPFLLGDRMASQILVNQKHYTASYHEVGPFSQVNIAGAFETKDEGLLQNGAGMVDVLHCHGSTTAPTLLQAYLSPLRFSLLTCRRHGMIYISILRFGMAHVHGWVIRRVSGTRTKGTGS